ncbi:MAG TPA: hypothetical protein VNH83_15765 [Bryobacteraceae bacterium]|nr:hypothetical protein [Bryobacteraceae bacterium]
MHDLAELLKAIAALTWPAVTLVIALTFRPQIRQLLGRLKRGKLLGQELELHDELRELQTSAQQAAGAVAALPDQARSMLEPVANEDIAERITLEAARSPSIALMLLAAELEKQVRHLLASMGLNREHRTGTVREALEVLERRGGLPRHIGSSARLFYDVRNRIVHGRNASDGDVLAAIDSGLTILRAVKAIPHEQNRVYHPGVVVYEDTALTRAHEGVKGIILETTSPGGTSKTFRIFPTTRLHFKKGRKVAWEWAEDSRVFGEAWYRDPDTNEIKYAWTASSEFVGRDLDDV